MGFNPFRPRKGSRKADYAMVIGAVLIVALLITWAFFG